MELVKSNVIKRVGGYVDFDMDSFVAAKIRLDEMVAKLENYLVSTKLYTEKRNYVWVEYEPELDDFVRVDELTEHDLKDIEITFNERDIFTFTQSLLIGNIGKVVNPTDNWENNKFYC